MSLKRAASYLSLVLVTGIVFAAGKQESVGDRLNVIVDPRMELLSTVQLLSGYQILNQLDFVYKQEGAKTFMPFKDHPAVQAFSEMSAKGFAFGAPVEMLLCLSDPPGLASKRPFTDFALRRAGNKENIERFAARDRRLQNEVASGFIFTPAIAKCLEGYEAHRDKYPTIVDFYGEIADAFGKIARQEKINIPVK